MNLHEKRKKEQCKNLNFIQVSCLIAECVGGYCNGYQFGCKANRRGIIFRQASIILNIEGDESQEFVYLNKTSQSEMSCIRAGL